MNYDFDLAINELMNKIKEDYYSWTSRNGTKELNEINLEMIDEFNESLAYTVGSKYIKVTKGGSVWGFIVKTGNGKFKAGDILKAASWSAPALNKSRGNIFEGNFSWVRWTGPAYL